MRGRAAHVLGAERNILQYFKYVYDDWLYNVVLKGSVHLILFPLSLELRPEEKGFNLYSEQSFYYSYYADLVAAVNPARQIAELTKDARAEYPHEINALERFNIYPEVCVAAVC